MNKIYIFLIVLMAFSFTGTGQRKHAEIEIVVASSLWFAVHGNDLTGLGGFVF